MSDIATPWTVAHQASLSTGFFRQEYWRGLPFPFPGNFPNLGIKLTSHALAGGFFTTKPPGKSKKEYYEMSIAEVGGMDDLTQANRIR